MKRRIPVGAVLMTSVVLAGVGCQQSSETEVAAQTAEAPAAGVPTFRVDPDWPEVPAEWSSATCQASRSMRRTTCGCCIAHGRCRR